jgi:hypothetical protein
MGENVACDSMDDKNYRDTRPVILSAAKDLHFGSN